MPHRAVIALGSNLGNRDFYLNMALCLIGWEVGKVVQRSSVIETPSWGFDSDPFLNQVVVVETELEPIALLDVLQDIERRLGRTEKSSVVDGKPVYHARTIDLDILDYDRMRYHDDRLTLPHPHIAEREFVLVPLRELGISIP
ncbi:MAG: 2-amino-4-hydroxy-6-hydroxymethyldihydropteridine diphosphokinase [Bacteroidales bacterium]|jgi:2-amino-4-hydroxy-6-hydroxymethyldihydropteridine diphosphokinase|nr:2-amino-4-hydroxy-6-hydroxymethyldihydropteridine diphosphokinase [Bacteroidales bacterium]